jgi:uncharacterized protein DUF1707
MTDQDVVAIRASDADRERVVEILRRGHVDGRLTLAELEERSATAYAARTWDDLVPLTADLPEHPGERPERPVPPVRPMRPAWGARGARERGGPPYVVAAVLLGTWIAAMAAFGVFIPPLPLLFLLVLRVLMRGRRVA